MFGALVILMLAYLIAALNLVLQGL